MKLLCIMRDSFKPPKLRVGEIYTYTGEWQCTCGKVWYTVAEIEPAHARISGKCPACKTKLPNMDTTEYHFYATRFIPYRPDELGVTASEVAALYQPFKPSIKEQQ